MGSTDDASSFVQYPPPTFQSLYVIDSLRNQPKLKATLGRAENCGITIRSLCELHDRIKHEMQAYCSAHRADNKFRHVCLAHGRCPFDHKGASFCTAQEASGDQNPLLPNLHTVVARYVKPWTRPFDLSYAASIIANDRGRNLRSSTLSTLMVALGRHPVKVPHDGLVAEIFISHNWSELFAEFVKTAYGISNENTPVWVCAFAINQNLDIGGALGTDLEDVPFARALRASKRMVVFMDGTALTLTRVWCVFELHLSHKVQKPMYVSLPDNTSRDAWLAVRDRLAGLDVRKCEASNENDLRNILHHIKGTENVLNRLVQDKIGEICADAETLNGARLGNYEVVVQALRPLCFDAKMCSTLHYAATASVRLIGFLLEQNADIDGRGAAGNSAAHFAAQAGACEALRFLVQAKADINATNIYGETPLHSAAKFGQTGILAEAVSLGAKIDARTQDKTGTRTYKGFQFFDMSLNDLQCGSPLHLAASSGHSESVSELVRLKADVNSCIAGFTPIFVAAANGHEATVRQLQDLKASLSPMSCEPFATPLLVAAMLGQSSMVSALLEMGEKVNGGIPHGVLHGMHPLFASALRGEVEVMRALIHAKADVSLPTSGGLAQGVASIHIAAFMGQTDAVLCLLDASCQADVKVSAGLLRGATAVTAAAFGAMDDTIMSLLGRRADVDSKMESWLLRGTSPLLAAAFSGHAKTVVRLVESKADLESSMTSVLLRGCTPLIAAAFAMRAEASQTLLDCNANVEAGLKSIFLYNARPMHAVALVGSTSTADVLYHGGASLWSPVLWWLFPPLLPMPLPPVLVASFSSIAFIIIAAIVIIIGPSTVYTHALVEIFIVKAVVFGALGVLDVPRFPIFCRLCNFCFRCRRRKTLVRPLEKE
eukprot:TRINITY_DN106057_c0_g1_i1.p1 TRINITY_DN106057_c0_g1~~TRINITY_DN106057_c0_g1_i1.p1  ORF type:complete len:887 (+),score=125.69 TRINITY_DN106057_c0_g1_i1:64-2724(+)